MTEFQHEVVSALRSLTRRPTFALLVIVTLAIGLGASAAMFAVVDGILLEPLPYERADRLVTLERRYSDDPSRQAESMSLPDLRDIQEQVGSLEAVAGHGTTRHVLVEDGEPRLIEVGRVTDGLLSVFALEPEIGRDLTSDDTAVGSAPAVVLGHSFWRRHFGADPAVLGQTLELSGSVYSVVGVAPSGFDFPGDVDLWIPWQIDLEGCGRGCHLLRAIGRLAAGVTAESATRELESLGAALEPTYPDSNTNKRFAAVELRERQVAPIRSALWLLLGAVQFVVLIAAVNVANLVLVRATGRRRELAIRSALGAGRWRLLRQLFLESALLAAAGAMAALAVGQGALSVFKRLAPPELPRLEQVSIDSSVLFFTVGLSFLVLLLFGLGPALRMARVELRDRGRVGSVDGRRSRLALITAEVALTLVLLLGAGLLLRSFVHLTELDLGFVPERVTRFSFVLPDSRYDEPSERVLFSQQFEERLRATPGIEAAGVAFTGPFGDSQISSTIEPLDRSVPEPGEELRASFDVVSAGFFDALRIQPVRGRVFTERDTRSAPLVVVVNATLADRYYPKRSAVGEQMRIGLGFGFDDEESVHTIVGVVPDIRSTLTAEPTPAVYMAQAQTGSPYLGGVVRSRGRHDVAASIREHLLALDPMVLPRSVESQQAAIDDDLGPQRFYFVLLASFAGIALVLSAIGLYGVVAYLVGQRTRELAVRMALGSDAAGVLRLVLGDSLRPAVIGLGLGLVAAALGARLLDSLLHGVSAYDATTYIAAPLILLTVAALACLSPALRAARIEPRAVLEEE